MKRVLAFDLGASSGRALLAEYENHRITCQEVHRFENNPREKDGCLRWDFQDLMQNIRLGLEKAGQVDSIAFDTWGVDFGLLDQQGNLLEDPVHYRDQRTDGSVEKAEKVLDKDSLYGETGTQIMSINTLFQLLVTKETQPQLWKKVHRMLFMPDLLAYSLCGSQACETTIASTSQLLDPRTKSWSLPVLDTFQIPQSLFPPLVKSGSIIGEYQGAKVIAAAGHDTQCAVAALPSPEKDAAFLSCGTWSLLGCELDEPILTRESRELGLSNEVGANGKINYLKNIIGLWLIQESRRQWRREGQDLSYAKLEQLALEAQPLRSFIDPDAPEFAPPGDIPGRVRDFCRRTGQPVPETVGQVMHLRKPGAEISLRPGSAFPSHGQDLLYPSCTGRRHQRRFTLPHDCWLHRTPGDRRAGGSHCLWEYPDSVNGLGRTGKHRRRPGIAGPHRSCHPLRTPGTQSME